MPPFGSLSFRLSCLALRLRAMWLVRRSGTGHPIIRLLAEGRWDVLDALYREEEAYTVRKRTEVRPTAVPSR